MVDDEESIQQAFGQVLQYKGFAVTTCPDAPTAFHSAQQGHDSIIHNYRSSKEDTNDKRGSEILKEDIVSRSRKQLQYSPDLIITDVRMLGMSGIEMVWALRFEVDLVPIPDILLTVIGQSSDRIAGKDAGADAYLTKPFDLKKLLTMMEMI